MRNGHLVYWELRQGDARIGLSEHFLFGVPRRPGSRNRWPGFLKRTGARWFGPWVVFVQDKHLPELEAFLERNYILHAVREARLGRDARGGMASS